jgi:DHA2 family multidrug resistance protein
MITRFVHDPPWIRNAKTSRIDGIGFGFMALGLATLQILLDKGQEEDWFGSITMRWLALTSVFSLLFFIFWELHTPEPIVNLRVLKNRNFGVAGALFFLFGAALYGLIALQPLFLQTLLGYNALAAGLTVTPRGIGAFCAMILVGATIARLGGRNLAMFGFVTFAFAAFLFSRLSLDISRNNLILPNIVSGLGSGFVFVPLTTVGMGMLPHDQIGNAAGIQNLLRNLGGSVGISFVSTMLDRLSQARQAFMTSRVSLLNPVYLQQIGKVQGAMQAHFTSPDAHPRAETFIYNIVQHQTSYWAFIDIFRLYVWLSLFCALVVLLLKKIKSTGAGVAAH